MKIAYIVPGFGNTFYCQNCIQNLSIFKAFSAHDHEAVLVPMYIPFNMENDFENDNPVFYGAINVYLKEFFKPFHYLPNWIQNKLNSKQLLNWISKKSGTTDPKGLEKMTISVMQGDSGAQQEELQRLITWLKESIKPDVVHLSNALLIGIGVKIKQSLNIPVFCTLQDEDHWLDRMEEPYASLGWQLIKSGAQIIDAFVSVSRYYADYIKDRLTLDESKFAIIPGAVDINKYHKRQPTFEPMTIGYLSRISNSLGIDILLDAFDQLKLNPKFKSLQLKISGGISSEDKFLYKQLKRRISKLSYAKDIQLLPDLYKEDINQFFQSLTLLTVPSHQPEASGLFLVESMAAGIPVVQPAFGGYAEIIKNTGGGLTYAPNTADQLAKSLSELLLNHEKLLFLSDQGKASVADFYSMEKMVKSLIELYNNCMGTVRRSPTD